MSRLRQSGDKWVCDRCHQSFDQAFSHPTIGAVCPLCFTPDPFAQAYRARKKRKSSPARLRKVAIRDMWQCWLCRGLVDPTATGEDRASVDHVVPVSLGGGNELENLRLAHQRCNNRREIDEGRVKLRRPKASSSP